MESRLGYWNLDPSRGATIKQMANDPKRPSCARTFWSRYSKDLFNWAVKTFWLRFFILLAVPVVLIYEKKHVDWATTFISIWLFAVVITGYVCGIFTPQPKRSMHNTRQSSTAF
jgi:hypothetical protein